MLSYLLKIFYPDGKTKPHELCRIITLLLAIEPLSQLIV